MGLRTDVENLSKEALEYIKRSVDGCKLRLVEHLSLLLGGLICGFVLLLLLFFALLALLAAVLLTLVPIMGAPLAILLVALLLVAVAVVVYLLRERLFVNAFVRHFVRIFFNDDDATE